LPILVYLDCYPSTIYSLREVAPYRLKLNDWSVGGLYVNYVIVKLLLIHTKTMKNKKISVLVAIPAVVIAISTLILTMPHQQVPAQPDHRLPVAIDTHRSVANHKGSLALGSTSHAEVPTGNQQPTTPRTLDTPTDLPHKTNNAPKQTEIRKSVAVEHTYYPLLTPNDPSYSTNWALQNVNAVPAWNITTGNSQTIVAVIDTGFALSHEDLNGNWALNSGEMGTTKPGDRCWTGTPQDKQTNNCDNDGDGYKNNWRGWNFSLGDNNPMAGRTNPNGVAVSHGTETAGLVGASGNNSLGIATINWHTKIMPLQALSDDGPGYTSDIAAAIYYAVDHGASAINLSLGGSSFDSALNDATNYAYTHNVVVIAAAGNCGTGTEQGCQSGAAGAMGYPALDDHVVSVGASDINNQRASFSSYGPSLSVVAPGSGSIVSPTWTSTNGTNLYSGSLYGTSFAAPQVASLVSLIKSIRPASSADDIRALLMATATKVPAMNGANFTNEYGHGIINAGNAVTVASSLNNTSSVPKLLQTGGVKSEHSFSSTDSLGSGCTATTNSYCATWLRDSVSGQERYLPYQQTTGSISATGWSWSGTMLTTGSWDIRAVQGDNWSTPYSLSSK
jgi:subtilisin family serine protease